MERDERVENKIDKLGEDITDIKVILAKQHVVLVQHESRSTKLESIVLPIQKKVLLVEGALKLIGFLALLASIAEVILSLMRH